MHKTGGEGGGKDGGTEGHSGQKGTSPFEGTKASFSSPS